jgi:mannose-1-phosphate guanylyltransferase
MEHFYALIMAGGGGTRLWPLSRSHTPKQFLPLVGEQSMFRTSVMRLAPLFTPERVYVVTGQKYIEPMRADVPEIPSQNFIGEPYGKDSGPAAALALSIIHKRDPQAVVAILTADHHIGNVPAFHEILRVARDAAMSEYTVTLGITPLFPATGFGYIRRGAEFKRDGQYACYQSRGFTEKPDVVLATKFVASGEYSWNSGMFIWTAEQGMGEFKRQMPDLHKHLIELQAFVDTPSFETELARVWEQMPRISLDFAVMQNAQSMAVIPVDIGWSDVGSWSSLFEVLPHDKFGNCFKGTQTNGVENVLLDTRNSLVYSNRLTVTIGVQDLVIVDTDDVLMICHRERAQDVKEVVSYLKATKRDSYL